MIGIKGRDMPKNCIECPCFEPVEEIDLCNAKQKGIVTKHGNTVFYSMEIPYGMGREERMPWCPLVEIEEGEEKHGSLEG